MLAVYESFDKVSRLSSMKRGRWVGTMEARRGTTGSTFRRNEARTRGWIALAQARKNIVKQIDVFYLATEVESSVR